MNNDVSGPFFPAFCQYWNAETKAKMADPS